MKLIILNAHSVKNLGDAAIVITMIEALKKEFANPEISVVSDTPEEDRRIYKDVKVSGIQYPWTRCRFFLRKIVGFLFHLKFWAYVLSKKKNWKLLGILGLQQDAREVVDDIYSSDVVISCGGGYINSLGKLYARMFMVLCGKAFNKPTIFYAQSVSDLLKTEHKILVAYTIKKSDAFIAREKITYDYLRRIGVPEDKMRLHADSAFILRERWPEDARDLMETIKSCRTPKIGISVTRWLFPGHRDFRVRIMNYIESVRRVTDWMLKNIDASVFVVPQVIGPSEYTDDRNLAKEVFEPLKSSRITLIKNEFLPGEIKSLIKLMDLFVGTRMHSNIFALGAGVPTLAIAYQDKTTGIMNMLDLAGWVVDINKIDGEVLIEKFKELWDQRQKVKDQLVKAMPDIEKSAHESAVLCRKIAEGGIVSQKLKSSAEKISR